jgi:hypothetical protein
MDAEWRKFCCSSSGLLKEPFLCFDRLSTNGKITDDLILAPFALSLSKGEHGVFLQSTRVES